MTGLLWQRIDLTAHVRRQATKPESWVVEALDIDGDGACYVTTFFGPDGAKRAMDYAIAAYGNYSYAP